MQKIRRCQWVSSLDESDPMIKYHDEQWCKPLHNDQQIFEMLILEMFQAGLSWRIIFNKRENFRRALNNFDYQQIAKYDHTHFEQLLNNPGIIRNQRKITAMINNAQAFIKIQKQFRSFDRYIWHFTDNQIIDHQITLESPAPAQNPLSLKISQDLRKHGFTFMGPIGTYSFIQAIGIVNDHEITCAFH